MSGAGRSLAPYHQVLAQVYKYDQLNRLKQAQGVEGLTAAANSWEGVTDAVTDRYKSAYTYDANGNMETLERYDGAGNQYDDLHFGYHTSGNGQKVRNRPYHIQDLADQAGNHAQDIPHHPYVAAGIQDEEDANNTINSANNFSYDELGQRTKDEKADIEHVEWTASGKVKRVQHTAASGKAELVFGYDAAGERISKQVGDPAQGGYREHYIRDAQGNIMAVYRYTLNPVPNTSPQQYTASLQLTDRPLYGSKRLGSHTRPMEMVGSTPPQYYPYTQSMPAYRKHYELTDHLGNVATVLSGRLLPDNSGTSAYQGEVLSAQGYEPFGMELPGRHWQSDVSRFGFQGQLKDREISAVPFKYRMYSPDGSGFWSVDPLAKDYPWNSPYAFAENKVIQFIELEGLEAAESAAKSGSTNTDNLPTLSDVLTQGSEINQNTLLPSVTIKRELPARIEPLAVADNSDNLGYFRSPSAAERETNPVGSLLKDISLPIINMSGVGAVDDWFGVATDANATAGDITMATINVMLLGRRGPAKLGPHPKATGPHSSFRMSEGRVTNFETYGMRDGGGFYPVLRFRGEGTAHGGVFPPMFYRAKSGKGPGAPLNRAMPPGPEDILPTGY